MQNPRKFSPASLVLARCGVSQDAVAEAAGFSRSLVSKVLVGTRRPPSAFLPAVKRLAGIDAAREIANILSLEERP